MIPKRESIDLLRIGAAKDPNFQVLESALKSRLGFDHALQFYDCPFRTFSFTALALYSNLHSSSFLYQTQTMFMNLCVFWGGPALGSRVLFFFFLNFNYFIKLMVSGDRLI